MKTILIAIAVTLLTGCAHTTLYSGGKKILKIQADATNVRYTGHGVTFSADSLMHSTATLAQGRAANEVLHGVATLGTSIGAAIATSGIVPAVK